MRPAHFTSTKAFPPYFPRARSLPSSSWFDGKDFKLAKETVGPYFLQKYGTYIHNLYSTDTYIMSVCRFIYIHCIFMIQYPPCISFYCILYHLYRYFQWLQKEYPETWCIVPYPKISIQSGCFTQNVAHLASFWVDHHFEGNLVKPLFCRYCQLVFFSWQYQEYS